ncbi:MAG: oligoribonuclease [Candidatus Nanopelagicales bacterium]|nr:oligoribonuclease [Candidatus Nanopelagicales bacterium]
MTKDRMVWLDLEMTGLDLETDEIVEIACIVTEADLTELDEGIDIVVKPNPAPLAAMDEFVVNMHKTSGLIDEIPGGTTLADAQQQVLAYIQKHVPEAGKAQLAGSSVYVDRGFLAKYMPELDSYLHYRLIDVSSIKELTRRWYPRVYFGAPEKTGNHRALADIRESIAELRYYRDAVFVAQPGPDSDVAKALGQSHVVAHGAPAHPDSGTGSVG